MNEERIERLACELADELGEYGEELMLKVIELLARSSGQAAVWKSYAIAGAPRPLFITFRDPRAKKTWFEIWQPQPSLSPPPDD